MNGAIDTAIAGGAGVVAVLALVIAYLARRDSRRSARAAKQSAKQARRSADSDEQMAELASLEAAQRRIERHEAQGPEFEVVSGRLGHTTGSVALRVVGGPGPMELTLRVANGIPWFQGFSSQGTNIGRTVEQSPVSPGDVFELEVLLDRTAPDARGRRLSLPMRIKVESNLSVKMEWDRRVSVVLEGDPPLP